jgi:hypothetical protein
VFRDFVNALVHCFVANPNGLYSLHTVLSVTAETCSSFWKVCYPPMCYVSNATHCNLNHSFAYRRTATKTAGAAVAMDWCWWQIMKQARCLVCTVDGLVRFKRDVFVLQIPESFKNYSFLEYTGNRNAEYLEERNCLVSEIMKWVCLRNVRTTYCFVNIISGVLYTAL